MTDRIEKKSKQKKPRFKISRGDPQKAMNFFNQAMTAGEPSMNPTGGMAEAVDTEISKKIERNLPKVKRDRTTKESVQLNEVGLSRIIDHIKDKKSFAIIGSQDKDTKESRYNELLQLLRKIPYRVGWNNLEGTYTYDNGEVGSEDSLIIYNIKKEDALKIAKKINQESIIWKDENFFGFLTAEGEEDGNFGGNLSFDKDAVKAFGSKLKGKHNNAKGFVFESSLVETTNRGSNFSRQHRAGVVKYPILKINEAEKMTKERNFDSFEIDIPYKDLEVEFYGGFDYDSGPWSDYKYMDIDYYIDWDEFYDRCLTIFIEERIEDVADIAKQLGKNIDFDDYDALEQFAYTDEFKNYLYDNADKIVDDNLEEFQDWYRDDAEELGAEEIANDDGDRIDDYYDDDD